MKFITWIRSFPQRYPWFWRNAPYAVMLGIVLAFVILAAIPQSACWAGCSARDKWCADNCTQVCAAGTRLRKIVGCEWNWDVAACKETYKIFRVPCPNGDNCRTDPYPWQVNRCDERSEATCALVEDYSYNTCCHKPSGGGSCDYAPPEILLDTIAISPPFPLTLGQDPDAEGVTVSLDALGGKKLNNCNGPDRANIKKFQVVGISLAESSRQWITQELALWYPGAYIKGNYPALPDWEQTTNLNKDRATLIFHFSPLDPGYYIVTVKAVQDRGSDKDSTAQLKVPVYLLETSIVR